jgi:hypothetical protein
MFRRLFLFRRRFYRPWRPIWFPRPGLWGCGGVGLMLSLCMLVMFALMVLSRRF